MFAILQVNSDLSQPINATNPSSTLVFASPQDREVWANALRGLAALAVIVFHYAQTFWVRQDVAAGLARRAPLYAGKTQAPDFAMWLDRFPIHLGAFGVALFFLLSGYVIALSLERYSRRGFLLGRLWRVLPTYAAGYGISCVVIALLGKR